MSERTVIDLETLGAASNDSEGWNCYISEKGVQALPKAARVRHDGLGKFLCHFFMGGKTYYLFENFMLDESLDKTDAKFGEFSDSGVFSWMAADSQEIPEEFLSEDIKTVSYMTLTNKELKLYQIESNRFLEFEVSNNILGVFSSNIICFTDEKNGFLTFVKNPIFGNSMRDDVSEISPMRIYVYRSFMPVEHGTGGSVYFTAENSGSATTDYRGERRENSLLILNEESIFLYEKDTLRIKALHQRRRRMFRESSSFLGESSRPQADDIYVKAQRATQAGGSGGINDNYLYYLHAFYNFGEGGYYPNYDSYREQFDRKWNAGTWTSLANTDVPDWRGETVLFIERPSFPGVYYPFLESGAVRKAAFGLWTDKNNLNSGDGDVVNVTGSFYGYNSNSYQNDQIYYAKANYFTITDDTTMADIWDYADSLKTNENIATPDNVNTAGSRFGTMSAFFTYIFEELKEPELWVNLGQYQKQKYLWAQRSRGFSLGTEAFTDIWPFPSADEEMEVAKYAVVNRWGNLRGKVTNVEVHEDRMMQFKDLSALEIYSYGLRKYIYTLFDWPPVDQTVEYKNAVYFTRIGQFAVENIDSPFFVPSNISDEIIGLYGEDRNIWTISKKSMEQFNIADAPVDPVQFVRLEKTFEQLVDWCGLNGAFEILTKEKSDFYLNGANRVAKNIFSISSKIMPSTAIKGIAFSVVETDGRVWLFDPSGRAFRALESQPVFAITGLEQSDMFASLSGELRECEIDSGNDSEFSLSFSYRVPKNILTSRLAIETAQYGASETERKRLYKIFKDGKEIRIRESSEQLVAFYKIGRGLNCRLGVLCSGYLKGISVEDTQTGQK